jgi:N utilization substance protein B
MTGKKPPADEGSALPARTAARLAAVQALYQMDLAGTDLNDVIEEFISQRMSDEANEETTESDEDAASHVDLSGADKQFFSDVLRAVLRRQRDIDPLIDDQLATGWRLVRVDSILRAILRAGVCELVDRPDVPVRVVINEYINVARFFFNEDEPRVVNGILDKVARKVRAAEFEPKR